MAHYQAVSRFKFNLDNVFTVRLTERQLMEIDLQAARILARNIPSPDNNLRVADLEEQLLLLDAIDFGFILPVLGQG